MSSASAVATTSAASGKWRPDDCHALLAYWVTHTMEWSQKPKSQFYNSLQQAIFPDRSAKSIKNKCEFLERTYRNLVAKMQRQGFDQVDAFPPAIAQRVRKEYRWFYDMHQVVSTIELHAKSHGASSTAPARPHATPTQATAQSNGPCSSPAPAPAPTHTAAPIQTHGPPSVQVSVTQPPAQPSTRAPVQPQAPVQQKTNLPIAQVMQPDPLTTMSVALASRPDAVISTPVTLANAAVTGSSASSVRLATHQPASETSLDYKVASRAPRGSKKNSPLVKVSSRRTLKTPSPDSSPRPSSCLIASSSSSTCRTRATPTAVQAPAAARSPLYVPRAASTTRATPHVITPEKPINDVSTAACPLRSGPSTPDKSHDLQTDCSILHRIPTTPEDNATTSQESSPLEKKKQTSHSHSRISDQTTAKPPAQGLESVPNTTTHLSNESDESTASSPDQLNASPQCSIHETQAKSFSRTNPERCDTPNAVDSAVASTFRAMRPLRIVPTERIAKKDFDTMDQTAIGRHTMAISKGKLSGEHTQTRSERDTITESHAVSTNNSIASLQGAFSKRKQAPEECEMPAKKIKTSASEMIPNAGRSTMASPACSVQNDRSELGWLRPLLDLGKQFLALEARRLELMEKRLEFDQMCHHAQIHAPGQP